MIETKRRTIVTNNRMGESKSQNMQPSLYKRKFPTDNGKLMNHLGSKNQSLQMSNSTSSSFEVISLDGYKPKNVDETSLVFTKETFDDVTPYPHSEITEVELEDLKELEQTFGKEWYQLFCFESSIRAFNSSSSSSTSNKRQKVEETN